MPSCSIRLVKWPESMQLQLVEKGTLVDTQVAQMYLAVPGLAGSAPRDAQPRTYSWTSPVAVPNDKIVTAAALIEAGKCGRHR